MWPPLAPVVGGAGSGPVAAAAPAPVVAAVAGGIGGSNVDNILQQNAAPDIHCRGSVVQAAAHCPQGTGFDTCQLHF